MWETAFIAFAISFAALIVVWTVYESLYNYPRVKKGEVVSKIFQDDHRWVKYIAMPTRRFHFVAPYLHIDEADWIIMIRDKKGREERLFISKESYNSLEIGDIYTKQRGDRYFEWVKTCGATDEEIETMPVTSSKE